LLVVNQLLEARGTCHCLEVPEGIGVWVFVEDVSPFGGGLGMGTYGFKRRPEFSQPGETAGFEEDGDALRPEEVFGTEQTITCMRQLGRRGGVEVSQTNVGPPLYSAEPKGQGKSLGVLLCGLEDHDDILHENL
jgi:hypothetical protein